MRRRLVGDNAHLYSFANLEEMMTDLLFQFGVLMHNTETTAMAKETLLAKAQLAEDLGYATVLLPDHLSDTFSPGLMLAAIASVTSRIRLGSCMYNADLRHPVQLAKEAATLDILSDGRFEFGVGAGQMRSEYEQAGRVFDPFPLRLERLVESLQLMKQLFTEESVTFHGTHYAVTDLQALPRPIQRPHPPIFMGGGGKHMLWLAAREADIIGLAPKGRSYGSGLEMRDALLPATVQKLAWLRQAAGDRLTHLEVSIQIIDMAITPDRKQGAARLAVRYGFSTEELLASPHFLVGTIEQICDDLQARREQYGISYIVVWEEHLQALAPIVARLANW